MKFDCPALALLATCLLTACTPDSDLAPDRASRPPDPGITSAPSPIHEQVFATLVLRGGNVITLEDDFGEVEALAAHGHEILAVGSDEEINAFVGPGTKVIDLAGRTVVPGFIEGHGHFLSLGWSKQNLDFSEVTTWSELTGMVAEAATRAETGQWILGRGWHQDKWTQLPESSVDGVPRNDDLNRAAPHNPVYLTHASGHAAMANDPALAAAGIGDLTADPAGGTIVRAPDGRATGLLRENAQAFVQSAISAWESQRSQAEIEEDLRVRVDLAGNEALRHGVTSFQDAGSSFANIDFFRMLEAEGALPVRLYVMVRFESNKDMDGRLADYRMPAEGNDFLAVRSIKRQIDGALGTHGAWLLEHYSDLPSTAGLVLESVEEIQETADIALRHGFQLNTHAIGDRANRETLDLYQRAFVSHGIEGTDVRWRIEHAQHVDPADVPRFAELGVIASMQGVHATSDGPWIAERLGAERAVRTSYVWRNLIDAGAMINNGTDVPVEPIDPIASFYSSVSRMMNTGERLTPAMAMTRREALESYTINNAYAAFEEGIKGTLAPGKLADMVVLSENILTIEEERIPDTAVDVTIVGGDVKYLRED